MTTQIALDLPPTVGSADRLNGVVYDLRGPVNDRADHLERLGHQILRLNIGDPAPFGFQPPEAILTALHEALPTAHGYSHALGLPAARRSLERHYALREGWPGAHIDSILVGNGVSELVGLTLQALLNTGDEVLIPAPDYPLWTASTVLNGGIAVPYPCDEKDGWQPDLEALEGLVTSRTRAIVLINPNNPTGAVYTREILHGITAIARRHGLLLMSDEIYDRVVYPGYEHISLATIAHDQPCLTFGGLSKTHRIAGYRAGWVVATGFARTDPFVPGLRRLASLRMCSSVPAQHAIGAALDHDSSLEELVSPGGRLFEQRATAIRELSDIPGVTCHEPGGGLYVFPRLDAEVHPIADDEHFALEFLEAEHVLVAPGGAFNWPRPDHLRIAFLPQEPVLSEAIGRLRRFLTTRSQTPRTIRSCP